MPVNKMLLQELISRNRDSDFRFSRNFWFFVLLPGENARFAPPADAHESNPPYLWKNYPWKNFKWSGNPNLGLSVMVWSVGENLQKSLRQNFDLDGLVVQADWSQRTNRPVITDISSVAHCFVVALSVAFCSGLLTWSANSLHSMQRHIVQQVRTVRVE